MRGAAFIGDQYKWQSNWSKLLVAVNKRSGLNIQAILDLADAVVSATWWHERCSQTKSQQMLHEELEETE